MLGGYGESRSLLHMINDCYTQESEMGFYINPRNMTKEEWLARNGTSITPQHAKIHSAGDDILVCLVQNDGFSAAGIAYDDRERDAFFYPDSGEQRPKKWFLVKREMAREFCNIL